MRISFNETHLLIIIFSAIVGIRILLDKTIGIHSQTLSTASVMISILAAYILYVRTQRYRYKTIHEELGRNKDQLTSKQYHEIFNNVCYLEFPFLALNAGEFALFNSFGIPSISKLLSKTKQFEPENVAKRYDDTDFLLREFFENGPDSTRAEKAMKRLNYIHGRYKISNDDFLYVLQLFVVQTIQFCEKYGYRKLLEIEKTAICEMVKSMGIAMNIKHIPINYKQMIQWTAKYENEYMQFNETNVKVGEGTFNLLISPYPKFLHDLLLKPMLYCTMNENLRTAMGFYEPANIFHIVVKCLVKVQKFIVKYFMLPRTAGYRRTALQIDETTSCFIPLFHRYEKIYKDGYKTEDLGPKDVYGNKKLSKMGRFNPKSLKDYESDATQHSPK